MVLLGMRYAKGPDGTIGFSLRRSPPPDSLPPALRRRPAKPQAEEESHLPGLPPPKPRRAHDNAPRPSALADGRSWACMASAAAHQPSGTPLLACAEPDELAAIGGLPPPGAQRATHISLSCPPGLASPLVAMPVAPTADGGSDACVARSSPPSDGPVGRVPIITPADESTFEAELRSPSTSLKTLLGVTTGVADGAIAEPDESADSHGTSSRLGMWFSAEPPAAHDGRVSAHSSAPPTPAGPAPSANDAPRIPESGSQSRLAAWYQTAQTPVTQEAHANAPAGLTRQGVDAIAWLQQHVQLQAQAQAQAQAEELSRQQQARLQAQHALALMQQQHSQQQAQQYQQQLQQYHEQQARAAQQQLQQQQQAEYQRRLQQHQQLQQRQPNPPLPNPPLPPSLHAQQPTQQAVAAQLAQLQQQSHQLLAALQQQRHQLTPQQQKQFEVQLQAWRQQQQRLALLQQQATLAAVASTPPPPAPSGAPAAGHSHSLLNPVQRQASHSQLSAMLMPHLSVVNGSQSQQRPPLPQSHLPQAPPHAAPSTSGLQQQMFQVQHLGLQQQLALLQAQIQGQQPQQPPLPPPPPPPTSLGQGSPARSFAAEGAPTTSCGFPPPPSHYPVNGSMLQQRGGGGGVDLGSLAALSLHAQPNGSSHDVLEQQTMSLKNLLGLGGGF